MAQVRNGPVRSEYEPKCGSVKYGAVHIKFSEYSLLFSYGRLPQVVDPPVLPSSRRSVAACAVDHPQPSLYSSRHPLPIVVDPQLGLVFMGI